MSCNSTDQETRKELLDTLVPFLGEFLMDCSDKNFCSLCSTLLVQLALMRIGRDCGGLDAEDTIRIFASAFDKVYPEANLRVIHNSDHVGGGLH